MTFTRVSDLDELALTVRDQFSKSYILEAINAYRGGALRSSIMSTWIAVSYDIIAKLRELANQGDKQAIEWVTKLDNAIKNKHVSRLQTLEEELLDKAHKDFELLAPHEYEDLVRLKKDRNYCAHPAFVGEDELFQPTPDLARMHIVHATLHLLRHQPVQGRSALNRIKTDMMQPYHLRARAER
jgi:hypothetical protein